MPPLTSQPRRLILRQMQSPGDIVMLTAAVRDLHAHYPGQFLTDVRTTAPQIWENNPHITQDAEPVSLDQNQEPGNQEPRTVEIIDCEYPLIHRSNQEPWHFIHAFGQFLADKLGLPHIRPTAFKGDIHLSDDERGWISTVEEATGEDRPFWIIVSGGKRDFTAKWWSPRRLAEVCGEFKDLQFVQVGERGHHHPHIDLPNVLDLRGKTDLRQLIRLVYHSSGVICPVTLLMHLAAAVPTRHDRLGHRLRPCVVVAGGREPSHWERYPGHAYLDTIGHAGLDCCAAGGCWKSRVVPLNDGSDADKSLCDRPVRIRVDLALPDCLDRIHSIDVIRAMHRLVG